MGIRSTVHACVMTLLSPIQTTVHLLLPHPGHLLPVHPPMNIKMQLPFRARVCWDQRSPEKTRLWAERGAAQWETVRLQLVCNLFNRMARWLVKSVATAIVLDLKPFPFFFFFFHVETEEPARSLLL